MKEKKGILNTRGNIVRHYYSMLVHFLANLYLYQVVSFFFFLEFSDLLFVIEKSLGM